MRDVDIVNRTVTLAWAPVAGAQSYLVEAGSSPGSNDVTTFSVSGGSSPLVTWSDVVPRDDIYVRVKAVNAAGASAASEEWRIAMPDFRDYIEALFLASGRYGEFGGGRRPGAVMDGWPSGARVSVRVPHELGGAQFDAVVDTVNRVNDAVGGALTLFIERATVSLAQFNQSRPPGVTIILDQGLCARGPGAPADVSCWVGTTQPLFTTGSVRTTAAARDRVYAHELGHGIGLKHVNVTVRVGQPSLYSTYARQAPVTMGTFAFQADGAEFGPGNSAPLWTDIELEAVRRVYASGLRPGSTIADFVARGLIKP